MDTPVQKDTLTENRKTARPLVFKKYIIFFIMLAAFIVLLMFKLLNPYSSPVSTVETLISGISASQQDIMLNEHFLFSNELTDRYGEEVHKAWLAVDREGKLILDRARSYVRVKGKDKFNTLSRHEKDDIEKLSYREYVTSVAYPDVKVKIPDCPDSMVFTDLNMKSEYVHRQGIKSISQTDQALIGNTSRRGFEANQAAFIREESQKSNARQARKKYNQRMKLYDQIEKSGMALFDQYFSMLEQEASEDIKALSNQQRNDILGRSSQDYIYRQGFDAVINDINNGAPDRYHLKNYSYDIFLNDEQSLQYRYDMGVKNTPSSKTAILQSFDYRIGVKIHSNLRQFIQEAGLIRLFDFIRDQISRESFTVTSTLYRSYETSLFYSHIAEVESNIGTFVVHQRNGEWYLADYR